MSRCCSARPGAYLRRMHASAEHWLGVLATGVLLDDADEHAVLEAERILGEETLASLRGWFTGRTPAERQETQCAVIEACIAMVHADRIVTEGERTQVRALIDSSRLDAEHRAQMHDAIRRAPRDFAAHVGRLGHPALRELLLVLAWELAKADGVLDETERATYGVLAAELEVSPERARVLRDALAPVDETPST